MQGKCSSENVGPSCSKMNITEPYRFSWPSASPTSPIPPGLFQASYGPHGIELIRLEVPLDNSISGLRGIKVTGDPNVPFDKTTFEIDTPGCLDIPMEEQQSCAAIQMFMEEPRYIDFQVKISKHIKGREKGGPAEEGCTDSQRR